MKFGQDDAGHSLFVTIRVLPASGSTTAKSGPETNFLETLRRPPIHISIGTISLSNNSDKFIDHTSFIKPSPAPWWVSLSKAKLDATPTTMSAFSVGSSSITLYCDVMTFQISLPLLSIIGCLWWDKTMRNVYGITTQDKVL